MNILQRIILRLNREVSSLRVFAVKKQLRFCGSNVSIHETCNIIVPQEMEIGDNSSISSYTTIYATYGVKIGRDVMISSNCGISSVNHIRNSPARRYDPQDIGQFSKPVVIGNNVWIGMNVCILPGIEIGKNTIIGAGSVVTKSIPANQVWVGNPARFVGMIELEFKRTSIV